MKHATLKNARRKSGALTVIRCHSLPAKDIGGSTDAYVVFWFGSDEKNKRNALLSGRTKTISQQLNPAFTECFDIVSVAPDLGPLNVEVWDHDTANPDDFIGKLTLLPALEKETTKGNSSGGGGGGSKWRNYSGRFRLLDRQDKPVLNKQTGEAATIYLDWSRAPGMRKLELTILSAEHLVATDVLGSTDPFVVLHFGPRANLNEKVPIVGFPTLFHHMLCCYILLCPHTIVRPTHWHTQRTHTHPRDTGVYGAHQVHHGQHEPDLVANLSLQLADARAVSHVLRARL
jgi:hypothetical protein